MQKNIYGCNQFIACSSIAKLEQHGVKDPQFLDRLLIEANDKDGADGFLVTTISDTAPVTYDDEHRRPKYNGTLMYSKQDMVWMVVDGVIAASHIPSDKITLEDFYKAYVDLTRNSRKQLKFIHPLVWNAMDAAMDAISHANAIPNCVQLSASSDINLASLVGVLEAHKRLEAVQSEHIFHLRSQVQGYQSKLEASHASHQESLRRASDQRASDLIDQSDKRAADLVDQSDKRAADSDKRAADLIDQSDKRAADLSNLTIALLSQGTLMYFARSKVRVLQTISFVEYKVPVVTQAEHERC